MGSQLKTIETKTATSASKKTTAYTKHTYHAFRACRIAILLWLEEGYYCQSSCYSRWQVRFLPDHPQLRKQERPILQGWVTGKLQSQLTSCQEEVLPQNTRRNATSRA